MPVSAKPNVRQRRVARALKKWRERADLTQDDLANQINWSTAKLSRYENGKQIAGQLEISGLGMVLGVDPAEVKRVVAIAEAATDDHEPWWRTYSPDVVRGALEDFVETESEAMAVSVVEVLLVPGLLQTGDYADAILRSRLSDPDEDLVEERRRLRLRRQARLDGDEPLSCHAIIHEAALRVPVGGPVTMAEQLAHIAARAQQDHVTVQVIPNSVGAYGGIGSAFHLVDQGDDSPAAAYLDNLTGGLYIEEDAELQAYILTFERLRHEVALDPDESLRRIEQIRQDWI